jgi:hypothetical protein
MLRLAELQKKINEAAKEMCHVGTMLRRRRSCRKKQFSAEAVSMR